MMVTTEQVAKTDEEFLREVADQIRARMWRVSRDIIGIGHYLIEARARVGSGKFSAWIETEFKMSRVTAYKMIKVAETFGETDVNHQFTPSVLYALVAPDTTDEVRAEIIGRAESGELINAADVKASNEKAKNRAYIVEHGVAALVEAVDRDEVSLSAAVVFVRHQQTTQQKLIEAAGSVAKAVTRNNAELKAKADKAAAAKETPSLFADVKDAAPKPKPADTRALKAARWAYVAAIADADLSVAQTGQELGRLQEELLKCGFSPLVTRFFHSDEVPS
jgi:hypothetical protein